MWNFQVAGLLVGATIVCYDGSPAYPDAGCALGSIAARLGVTVLGTSPAYLAACRSAGVRPGCRSRSGRAAHARRHRLDAAGARRTTGSPRTSARACRSPRSPAAPTSSPRSPGSRRPSPVWAGEISTACLGVALDAFDEQGRSVRDEVGELVITKPMPSMPVSSGTTRTARATATPTSTCTPACGGTATG